MRLVALLCLNAFVAMAQTPAPALTVSAESAPAGGWAQFKFSVSRPAAVGKVRIQLPLDAGVFSGIESGAVFGANGDAAGAATVSGLTVTLEFTSRALGIGRAFDLPVIATVTARVRADATAG